MTQTQKEAPSRGLHIGLWVVQALLALFFGGVGAMKTFQPIEALAEGLPWVLEYSAGPALIRFIGVSELLGGLGLVLPALTKIKPRLTPLAAAGLALVMILAALFHLVRGELSAIGVNVVLGALAAFVAWGRHKKAPIAAR